MPTIDLGKVADAAAQHPFWAARGHAIQAYATLEQSLCTLFSHIGDMPEQVAAVIFFKITSANARNSIFDKLIRKKFGSEYSAFWNPYLKELHNVDLKRNEIVHWVAVNSTPVLHQNTEVMLKPPATWVAFDINAPTITTTDLNAFIEKCDFFSRSCNIFIMVTRNGADVPEPHKTIYLELFRQTFEYPPPAGHPLLRIPTPLVGAKGFEIT